ncbi:uncharacterized protein LOC120340816 [Styela clava]|uniref:transcription factor E4F1-like n=1 Tax=Styela clava TaxID=7725 RepID=UPI00193AB70F|nr:transcription factor E4F1-like [Styela clava]
MNEHTCEICLKQFSLKNILTRHQSSVHNKRKHKCHECGKIFSRPDSLTRHRKNFHRHHRRWHLSLSLEDKNTNAPDFRENASIARNTKIDERISPPALITLDPQMNNFPVKVKQEAIDQSSQQTDTATSASKSIDISLESHNKKQSESQAPEKQISLESVTEPIESGSQNITLQNCRVPQYTLAILNVLEIYGEIDEFKSTIPHLKKYFVRDNWTSINFCDIEREDDLTKRTLIYNIKRFLLHLIKNKYDYLEKIVPPVFWFEEFLKLRDGFY